MQVKRVFPVVLITVALVLAIAGVARSLEDEALPVPQAPRAPLAPTTTWTLQGRVYQGEVGQEWYPLQGVTVAVYGANSPHPDRGTLIRSTTTDAYGWYGIDVYDDDGPYSYYYVYQTNLSGYVSVGATTVSGTVRTADWIEYAAPLTGQTLTGNKFWDDTASLSGRVYEGSVGVEDNPREGVVVSLYGANNPYPDGGTLIISTTTNAEGWYGLEAPAGYEFYHLRESDPEGYGSEGATTVGGTVRTDNWIEYVIPFEDKTLTGNKFWDQTATTTYTLQGRVFEGDVGVETNPLVGVTVEVYGASGPYPDPGELIAAATTAGDGRYGLVVPEGYDYYHVREADPDGYVSVGATTVSGTVQSANWIQFAAPLTGKTLTGNTFWDHTQTLTWTLEGQVYSGTVGVETDPLAGVTVAVYGANNPYPDGGVLITATTTGGGGAYSLVVEDGYEFYHLRESDPEGFASEGTTTLSGTVRTDNWIEVPIPLDGKNLTGNTFWDLPATMTYTLEGWVYEGAPGVVTGTLPGVVVSAYGSDTPYPDPGELIAETATDGAGWYGLVVPDTYAYYHLRESDPEGLVSVDATTLSGTVRSSNWIEYQAPLTGQHHGDNLFWDEAEVVPLPDLVVGEAWREGQTICYQLINVGAAGAPAGFTTTLTLDGAYATDQPIEGDLQPEMDWVACFDHVWACSAPTDTVKVTADFGAQVEEWDEDNNAWEEVWPCDLEPPQIISGPVVLDVTTTSAVIGWGTNEEANSAVLVGRAAGVHDWEESDPALSYGHTITLTGLDPATTYHYLVRSVDGTDLVVESPTRVFQTLPEADGEDPTVSLLLDPGTYTGTVTVSADASDNTGVEKVEFFFDGDMVFIDYSPPFEFDLDTTTYGNGPYTLTATAHDLSGRTRWDDRAVGVGNAVDGSVPQVTIVSPADGANVSGQVSVTALLTDDVGLAYAYLRVNGDFEAWEPLPSHPKTASVAFSWDTTVVTDTTPRVAVEVYDTDFKYNYDYHDVTISAPTPPAQPKLKLVQHVATRVQNGLVISLTVKNVGAGVAREVSILDSLRAFQPLSRTSTIPTPAEYYPSYTPSTKWWDCLVVDPYDLQPGEARTYVFSAVPVMVYPGPPAPSVGETVRLSYQGSGGTLYDHQVKAPIAKTTGGDTMLAAHLKARKEADYLIVTNPQRLFWYYDQDDVDALLSDMAQMAIYEQGVLGFLYTHDRNALDALIAPFDVFSYPKWGDNWAIWMAPSFSKPLGGYVLIVGETEIVPAWQKGGFSIGWNPVKYSDHPYADTGGTPAPDLIVGRIIGDSATALSKPIRASNGVYGNWPGYSFDRDRVLMVSGPGYGSFVSDVNTAATIMQPEFTVSKMHWKDYFVLSAFYRLHKSSYGFAAGSVTGTSTVEIVVANADADAIQIFDYQGNSLGSFTRSFDAGDQLAVGDVLGGGDEEIVVGDVSADAISIYDGGGTLLHQFNRVFDDGDGLVTGDVLSTGKEQILQADASYDYVYVTEIQGSGPGSYTAVYTDSFTAAFDKDDGFAAGDVMGDGREEVVVADLSQDRVYVRRFDTGLWTHFSRKLEQGDGVTVGNAYGAAKSQVILADVSHRVVIYEWNNAKSTWYEGHIPYTLSPFDGIAAGNVGTFSGTNKDEILVASTAGVIHTLDHGNFAGRVHTAFPGFTQNTDVIYWSGHGNKNVWDGAINSHSRPNPVFPVDFNGHNPFILGTSCLTGNYQDGNYTKDGTYHVVEDKNIAESFLASGAAIYVGATESSNGYQNREAAQYFFKNWGPYETIGEVFTQLERSYWKGNQNDDWWFWVWQHNLYGDPKFGAEPVKTGGSLGASLATTEVPTSPVHVEIPDYVVSPTNGLDWVAIPGGRMWTEPGKPWIPYYVTTLEVPQGHEVQRVTLVERTGMVTDTGLAIPMVPLTITACACQPEPYAGDVEGWFPEEEVTWETIENPDGSTTLAITSYPFYWNTLSTDVMFFKHYTYTIDTLTSTVAITGLATAEPVAEPGDVVSIELALQGSAGPQDVVVGVEIREYATDQLVEGLLLETLSGLSGLATFSSGWDTAGADPGLYYAEATVKDLEGSQLDRRTCMVQLGQTSGAVADLVTGPTPFTVGETVAVSLVVSNTGTLELDGTAIVEVRDEAGTLVHSSSYTVTALAPGVDVGFGGGWDTAGVADGTYTVLAYVTYDSTASDPLTVEVSTRPRIFLPLVMRQ